MSHTKGSTVIGAGVAIAGSVIAGASTLAETAGIAAVVHSSGSAILTSIGAGGSGYIAGTMGTLGAAALGALSAPVAIGAGTILAVAGTGFTLYSKFRK